MAQKKRRARGSQTGRPIMVLFDVLGRRWTLRILWELRDSRLNFRTLRSRCAEVSPTVLNSRLKELRELELVDHTEDGYGLTDWGEELGEQLMSLSGFARRWGDALDTGQ
jgi:DNA-binding HxlR family transcriptional regulator